LKITIFNGKIHYKWPFSIAMLNYQRVMMVDQSVSGSSASEHPTSFFCTSMFEAGNLPVVEKSGNPFQQQTTSNNIKQPICVCA
jgi:hypothetical protein